jgi:hypothetical protein
VTGFNHNDAPELVVAVPAVYFQALAAKFHHGDSKFGRRPVVAWDDAGFALVADLRAGRLVRAADDPVFVGLEPVPGSSRPPSRRGRRTEDEKGTYAVSTPGGEDGTE